MTNHAVDKQFALLEKETWPSTIQSFYACILLPCSLKHSLLYNTENNLWQPAPRTTPTEKQWSHIQQSREPMLCSLLQSLKRALLTYFTSIPLTLISCLSSQNLGCELKLCRHTTLPISWWWSLHSLVQVSNRRTSTALSPQSEDKEQQSKGKRDEDFTFILEGKNF